jgi:xanthine/uracil permease
VFRSHLFQATSKWVSKVEGGLKIFDVEELDFTLQILFGTGMFVAALTSVFLDNTIPGKSKSQKRLTSITACRFIYCFL